MRAGFLAAVLLCAAPLARSQPDLRVKELTARLGAIRAATDFRANGRLVAVAASGQRRTYQISLRARWFTGALKIFCEITDPAPARVRLLLESPAAGPASIRKGHAGDPAPVTVPFESWGDGLLETAFTYEDLLENQFEWHKQTLTGEASYGARGCYVLKSVPEGDDRSHYSTVTSMLDRETLCPLHVEKTVRATGAVKEFIYYGLRESKGVWSASQVEVKTAGKPGSSLLIVTRGAEKAHLAASDFDAALLTKP
ncbi:MAG TPA: outer membrane lipoprotein-sorting protein [Bryobacteraceae bacterium]|nr:outer membrane lipoprotein-sorting protein [Bryobacteraceae bacterium]